MENKIYILGGANKLNELWNNKIQEILSKLDITAKTHNYSHWKTNNQNIEIELESKNLLKKIKQDCIIVSKSAGSIIAAKSAVKSKKIKKIVVFGYPLTWGLKRGLEFYELFSKLNIPLVFIQQKEDPFGPSDELIKEIKKLKNNPKFTSIPGNDHRYDNFILIEDMLKKSLLLTR